MRLRSLAFCLNTTKHALFGRGADSQQVDDDDDEVRDLSGRRAGGL
jgi:hypothetical protein